MIQPENHIAVQAILIVKVRARDIDRFIRVL